MDKLREEIKEILTDTFFNSIFSKEMHGRELSTVDEQAFDECVGDITNLIKQREREFAKTVWDMSKALYSPGIERNDIAMQNHNALKNINKFCAEYLKEREQEDE